MATPTLGLTFNDLILRIAEYLGVADYTSTVAAIPTDVHDLDMCKRIANDGYARFLQEYPWSFLNGTATITPTGLTDTFDMPDDFQGELTSTFTYATTGPVAFTKETTEEHIRTLKAGRSVTGYPSLFAIQAKPAASETTTASRWDVVFWPLPVSTIDTLTAAYKRVPSKLTNTTDRSLAGPGNDQAVKQAAMAAAEIQRYGQSGPQEELYTKFLATAIKNDARKVPKSLGYNGDGSDEQTNTGRWPSRANQVDTYNGVSVE